MKTYDILNAGPKNRFSANGRIVSNSGRAIQLQNLVRNELSTLNEARELIKMGCFEMAASIYGNVPDVLSQLIRTMLIPKPGHEFIVADFSAIEARVLAWLAGEQWRLDAFTRGEDIYCASASAMFGVPVVKHGINGELRQKGKIAELACIAEGQLVLTDHGLVPIEKVTTEMKLWDGNGWVKHDGVVFRGERKVITYDGLTATPEHLVYFDKNKLPVPFEKIAISDNAINTARTISTGNVNSRQMPVYDILNAGRHHRFTVSGKLVHNCGYQGGSGALTAMGALDMGLKEDDLPKLIEDWRKANPEIVQFWWDLEAAARETIKNHQDRRVGKIEFQFYENTLWLVLPSGRKLAYINPKLKPNKFGRMSLTYDGLNAANKWDSIETYGGKLAENCIAEGTLVMTNHGLVPIENITSDVLIWDGIEWVHHEGVIYKGLKEVIELCCDNKKDNKNNKNNSCCKNSTGIFMTPDHKILTEKGWRKCGESNGLDWAKVWLPDSHIVSSGSSKSWMAKGIAVRKTGSQKQVYDIRNCGSRHRFTVWDPGGECLRVVSNCTQATARDLLAEAMWRMEQAGLEIVAHVHDEVVLEVPKGTVTVNDVCKIMNQNSAWAEGLPLASDGYSGNYYRKS